MAEPKTDARYKAGMELISWVWEVMMHVPADLRPDLDLFIQDTLCAWQPEYMQRPRTALATSAVRSYEPSPIGIDDARVQAASRLGVLASRAPERALRSLLRLTETYADSIPGPIEAHNLCRAAVRTCKARLEV